MKKICILATVLCMFSFFSCKKNDDVPAPQPPVSSLDGKVKTATITAAGQTVTSTFEYYPDGRVFRQTNSNGKTECAYTDGFAAAAYSINGVLQQTTQYILDAEGKAVVETYLNPNGTQSGVSYSYTYNADKRVNTTVYKNNGSTSWTRYNYYSGGNLVKDSLSNPDGTWQVSTHEYYLDTPASTETTSIISYIFGNVNKNLRKKITTKYSDGSSKVNDYGVPEKDSKGRVIKHTQTGGGITYTFEYTYY